MRWRFHLIKKAGGKRLPQARIRQYYSRALNYFFCFSVSLIWVVKPPPVLLADFSADADLSFFGLRTSRLLRTWPFAMTETFLFRADCSKPAQISVQVILLWFKPSTYVLRPYDNSTDQTVLWGMSIDCLQASARDLNVFVN